ncbi:nonribosomal peptide synthetase [Paramyrothecium foliicola]|nr:nonribosomal peptide synthetase [Paramyrothecium foliicola]
MDNGVMATHRPIDSSKDIETVLCEEFAGVLGTKIGSTDDFFDFGGDSMTAEDLAVRLSHRLKIRVTVNEVFDKPVPAELANSIRARLLKASSTDDQASKTKKLSPFQLLAMNDPERFVRNNIAPQINHSYEDIVDVYPATWIQQVYLHDPATGLPRPPVLFFVDFPCGADYDALVKSVQALVQQSDIFRTIFVRATDSFYQVVLKQLNVPIEITETGDDINQATREWELRDIQNPLSLGQSFLRVAILKGQDSSLRLLLRMSHALYDGLSFQHILKSLHALYNGQRLSTPPKFAQYVQHLAKSREHGYDYWRSVLLNSTMTNIQKPANTIEKHEQHGMWYIEKLITAPNQTNPGGITPATVFTAAFGRILAKVTQSHDIVFGRIVSGRQCLPISCQRLIGPCANCAPVRMRLTESSDLKALLRDVQDQYLKSLPYETLGFDEIKKNCTDWPSQTPNYGCCTVYQGFDMKPESQIGNQRLRFEQWGTQESYSLDSNATAQFINLAPPHDVSISGTPEPDGVHVRVFIGADERLFEAEQVERLMDELDEEIKALNLALQV